MRKVILASLAALTASPAFAGGSITTLVPSAEGDSILTIGCPSCVKKEEKKEEAKMLPPGTEITEIRDIDGQKMVYTTESWLGGSPVTIVRKATEQQIASLNGGKTPDDAETTVETAKVEPSSPVEEPAAQAEISADTPVVAASATPSSEPAPAMIDEEAVTAALPEESSEAPKEFDPGSFQLRTAIE